MKIIMGGKSIITGLIITLGLLVYIPFSDFSIGSQERSGFGEGITETSAQDHAEKVKSVVSSDAVEHMEADHPYLNTINWMILQPRDLSSVNVTTTAKSQANEVYFTYQCGDEEINSKSIPAEGVVENAVEWDCKELMTTHIKAVGDDTTYASYYTIDMEFINNLGF